jgi:large subunit ribosomal protein L9
MKVILLQDVKKVGRKGEVVEVSDGYASNFLFPRKLAVKKTDKSTEILEQQKEDARLLLEKQKEEALKIKEQLANIVVEFTLKSNNGKVFGSVSFKQVEEELKAKHNIVIDKRKITTKGPIDQLGYTKLNIELFKGVIGIITVHVKEEK